MGMYDTIEVPCPKCGEMDYFQSKSGDCICELYTLETVPENVLKDVNRHSPSTCSKCSTVFEVGVRHKEVTFLKLVAYSKIVEI